MTVRALRYQLDTYHLDSTGRREVILKRLLQHLSSGAHPSPATGGNDSTASSSSAQRQPPDPSGSDDGESASASDSSESEDLNSPTPSPPQAPASPSMSSPAAPQPTVLGKGAAAISAKVATSARDNPLLPTNIPGIVPDDITHPRRSRSSSSSSSSSTYRSRSRRRHSSSSSDSNLQRLQKSRRRRHHHYYTSSSDSSPSRHLSGVSCAPPVPGNWSTESGGVSMLISISYSPTRHTTIRHSNTSQKTTPPVQRTAPSYRPGFVVGGMESVFVHSPFHSSPVWPLNWLNTKP